MKTGKRIAVVGSGISGLAAAWLLDRSHDVTLFEAAPELGGHTHTVDVTLEGKTHPVDTGFLVFNDQTYPNLVALFSLLGVDSVATEMSFSVSLEGPDLEWAGSSLATIFGQKRNLLLRPFWRMLSDILRFNREATAWLAAHPGDLRSVGDFLAAGRYSPAFSRWYLLPMAAAIWSCPTGQMLAMPLATFVCFCRNHGLLQVFDRPLWRTVKGGGREYVRRLAAQVGDIRLSCPVVSVTRDDRRLTVRHAGGAERFDHVVMACHSDQSLRILGPAATPAQRSLLAAVRYVFNPVSFWFCYDRSRSLIAVLAEVNNTFGGTHSYLLHNDGLPLPERQEIRADKRFHVSPFCTVAGHYDFRFRLDKAVQVVRIDYHDGAGAGPLLLTAISGKPAGWGAASLLRALLRMPLLTFGVVARIHWQALRLWIKKVPFHGTRGEPAAPTLSQPRQEPIR